MTVPPLSSPYPHARPKPPIPDWVWAPLVSGGLMLLVGGLGLVAHQPWLFPSLGPTAFLQADQPDAPFAKFYHTVVGHGIGLCTGLGAVFLFHANSAPGVLGTGEITSVRVGAAVLAVTLNMFFGILLNASHPPAAATTLLVALGGFKPVIHDILTITIGVVIVAVVGEWLRRWRLQQR
jgi:HPP family